MEYVIPNNVQKCNFCGSKQITNDYNDKIVCMNCGLVFTTRENILLEQKLNINKLSARKDLVGGFLARDTLLNKEKELHSNNNRSLEKWWRDAKVSDSTEKNIALAFSEITKIGNLLSLPKIILKKASTTYKKLIEKRYIKGRSLRSVSAATVYIACKQCGYPITIKEIAYVSKMGIKEISKNYRFIVKELKCRTPHLKLKQYLTRSLDKLEISENTKEIIEKILDTAEELKLISGRNPISIVSAALYIALILTGEKRTQREIAETTRITQATIRNRYKELIKNLSITVSL